MVFVERDLDRPEFFRRGLPCATLVGVTNPVVGSAFAERLFSFDRKPTAVLTERPHCVQDAWQANERNGILPVPRRWRSIVHYGGVSRYDGP